MTDRVVMELTSLGDLPREADGGTTVWFRVREPEGYGGLWRFRCTGSEEVFAALGSSAPVDDVVSAAGRRLFDALTAPPVVRDVLTVALAVQEPDRLPIYLNLTEADGAQSLPWEAICTAEGKFLALNPSWPVARMVAGSRHAVVDRVLEPPLRIAAVLSCLGVEAQEEWEALRAAVEESAADVRMLVLVSEDDLHDKLSRLGLPWLTVGGVPLGYGDLQRAVTQFDPHLLHFFCHGSATGGAHLEIASAADWFQPGGPSRHRLEARSIRDLMLPPRDPPWAITLNACSSAAMPDAEEADTQSLAAALVRDHGVPAVIGMREPVLSPDAARFTKSFFTSLLTELREHMEARTPRAAIDWATFTVPARTELCHNRDLMFEAAARRFKQWTLPVVTVRPKQFTIAVTDSRPAAPDVSEEDRRIAEVAEAMLAALPADTPPETRAALLALVRPRQEPERQVDR